MRHVTFGAGLIAVVLGFAACSPTKSFDSRRPTVVVTVFPVADLVAALKDALSGNLDRIQIVKGWVDSSGKRHEKVYDVAWSGERQPGANGKLPAVGNTVDIKNATWTNSIGAPELITSMSVRRSAVVASVVSGTRSLGPNGDTCASARRLF